MNAGQPSDPTSILRAINGLTEEDLLAVHREVCRRAAAIYTVRYAEVRERHYRNAMSLMHHNRRQAMSRPPETL